MDGDLALSRSTAAPDGPDVQCPYPGLASFTDRQAEWFYGRDRLTATLASRLDDCLVRGGPVMVLAASGAGKSSLLRAGLLPRIAAGALTPAGSRHWPAIVLTPGAHPMRAAAAALLAAVPAESVTRPLTDPGAADLDCLLSLAVAPAGPGARAVLVVDQFEELFRLCEDEAERGAFISWLGRAADGGSPAGPAALAACAVRADFYRDCLRYPELRQALQDNQVIVGAMSRDELSEAITGPAAAAGLDIEPGLTELLLADLFARRPSVVGGNGRPAADDGAGRLPLLAHTLRVTWQHRRGSTLTAEGYRTSGRIEHAIAQSAEQIFGRLDATARPEARGLFLRLVTIGATSGEDVCRPVPRMSLISASASAGAVIDAYTGAQLMTESDDAVQITHEALLRAWPRLDRWLSDERAGQLTRQRAEDDAAEWDYDGQDPYLLYRGARLEAAATWADNHNRELTDTARQFITASSRLARRTRLIQRGGITILAVLLLIATVTSAVGIIQGNSAGRQSHLAQSGEAAARSDDQADQSEAMAAEAVSQLPVNVPLGMLLALQSYRRAPTPQAASALIEAAQQPLDELLKDEGTTVGAVAFTSDGALAVGGDDGVGLWDVATGQQTTTLDKGNAVDGMAFSPDGRTVAVGGDDGDVGLWDVATGHKTATLDTLLPKQAKIPLTEGGNPVSAVAFGPGGATLATAESVAGAVDLWDVTTGRRTAILFVGSSVDSVAFSPNGQLLAVGDVSGDVGLWDVATGRKTATLDEGNAVGSVAFSPGGGTLAVGDDSGAVGLWDVGTGLRTATLDEGGSVGSVAFSPDGGLLAVGDIVGDIGLWNVATGQQTATLHQGNTVGSVAFSPDGRTLAAGDDSGGIGLWDVASNQSAGLTAGSPVDSMAFSPGGGILAVGAANDDVGLWDAATEQTLAILDEGAPVASVAFSPGGILAVGDDAGDVGLWDAATGRRIATLDVGNAVASMAFSPSGRTLAVAVGNASGRVGLYNVATGHPTALFTEGSPVASVAFSPDGTTLAVGDDGGDVGLWAVATGRKTTTLAEGHAVDSVAFSPDSRTLAVGDHAGDVGLWEVATGQKTATLTEGTTVNTVAFSPDGSVLVTGDSAGNVDFWNADSGRLLANLPEADGGVADAAFSPSGQILAIGGENGSITLLRQNPKDLTLGFFTHLICGKIRENLTPAQWAQFAPGQPYQKTCPGALHQKPQTIIVNARWSPRSPVLARITGR